MTEQLDRKWIEDEVQRLSPWYYSFDLRGVRTDSTPPCDYHGHRQARLPESATSVLRDRTVLDVGCNEGGYTFAALDRGARSVEAFDVRAINIEKALFVARVRGDHNVSFSVASTDSWLASHTKRYDVVFLCGLLYHVAAPWQTIADYCRRARETVFVTCVLNGGADGYSPFPEQENIAASRDAEPSQMPNTTRTLIKEFAKHGFLPAYIGESRSENHWGGCSLLLRNAGEAAAGSAEGVHSDLVELCVLPSPPGETGGGGAYRVLVYNWSTRELDLEGWLSIQDSHGHELTCKGPQPLRLPARVDSPTSPPSESQSFDVTTPPRSSSSRLVFSVHETGKDSPLASIALG